MRRLPSQSQPMAPQRKRNTGTNTLSRRSTPRRWIRYVDRLHTGQAGLFGVGFNAVLRSEAGALMGKYAGGHQALVALSVPP